MSRQLKKKRNKHRHTPRHKDPNFQHTIDLMAADSMLTMKELEELNTKSQEAQGEEQKEMQKDEHNRLVIEDFLVTGENITRIDSLNGHWLFKDERLERHVDLIKTAINEFDDEFFTSDDGVSIRNLRRDKKGRVWGNDRSILNLCYLAMAAGMAEWTYPRKEWVVLPEGLPYIRFKTDYKIEKGN